MSMLLTLMLVLAPVTNPETLRQLNEQPSCPEGIEKCDPWERFPPVNPYARFVEAPISLGPGPHVLVISDGQAMTRFEYVSGPACQKARDQVRLQTDARLTNTNPGVIYGPPRVNAFCVPR